MDEHYALADDGVRLTEAMRSGDLALAEEVLQRLLAHLETHVRREEDGVFTALRDMGEFTDEIDQLEQEHVDLDAMVAGMSVDDEGFLPALHTFLTELTDHMERENLGIFPVSVVTLGADGWNTVERAREARPTFLDTEGSGEVTDEVR